MITRRLLRRRRRPSHFFFLHPSTACVSVASSFPQRPLVLQLPLFLLLLENGPGDGLGVGLGDLDLGHAGGPLEWAGGEVGEWGRREGNLEGLLRRDVGAVVVVGGGGWGQLRVLNLALGEVAEGGTGVFEGGGVADVSGGEGVAG